MSLSVDSLPDNESWSKILALLTLKARQEGTIGAVKKARSLKDRVRLVQEAPGVRSKLASWISHCSESHFRKSGIAATKLRDEGNIKFRNGDFKDSLKLYSESVICAPEFGPELSLAFGNRSAALFHQDHLQECLNDIDLALQYRFPKDTEFKLHQRKGLCLMKIGRCSAAIASLEKACESLEENGAKLPKRRKQALLKDIKAQIIEVSLLKAAKNTEGKGMAESNSKDHSEDVSFGDHSIMIGASSALDLKFDDQRGRYIVTNREVRMGDILFSELPFASVLLPDRYATNCHHCVQRFLVPIPCLKCTQARYCSEECRLTSWQKYHQYECGNLELLSSVGVAHLAERIVLVAGLERLLSSRLFFDTKLSSQKQSLTADAYSNVLSLVDHFDAMSGEDLFQYSVTATLLSMLLEQRTKFFLKDGQTKVDEGLILYTSAVLLRHIGQLICNASAIFEVGSNSDLSPDLDQVGGVYSENQYRVATAIYTAASMMNHSCDPSVINCFAKSRIVIRAIKDMERGQEVLNCYGPHYQRQRLKERQELLLSQYNFHCMCAKCSKNSDAEENLMKFTSFRCHHCDGPIPVPDDEASSLNDCEENGTSQPCLGCGHRQELFEQLDKLFMSHELLSDANDAMSSMDYNLALIKLKRCLDLRQMCLFKYHEDIAEVKDKLAQCYAMTGQYAESRRLLLECRNYIEQRYGAGSIESGHEMLKFADVIGACMCNIDIGGTIKEEEGVLLRKEAFETLRQAAKIFRIHYGPHHATSMSVNDRMKKL